MDDNLGDDENDDVIRGDGAELPRMLLLLLLLLLLLPARGIRDPCVGFNAGVEECIDTPGNSEEMAVSTASQARAARSLSDGERLS